MKIASKFSDGIIIDKPEVDPSIIEYAKSIGVPVLAYQGEEYAQAYSDFYETVV
jgi:starch synthase